MKKNYIGSLCFAMIAVLLFTGCNATPAAPAAPAPAPAAPQASDNPEKAEAAPEKAAGANNEPVSLRFSWWGGDVRHKATLDAIELYKKVKPNVTIEPEYGGFDGYYSKLLTQLAGGTAPDIIQVDFKWVPDLMKNSGQFVNMLTLDKKIDFSGFDLDFAKQYGGTDDFLIGLPVGVNGMGYVYNVDFLKKYGIEPSNDWTWDKLIEEGTKVNAKDPKNHLLYLTADHFIFLLKAQIKQLTGNNIIKDDYTLGFTNEQLTDYFKYVVKLVETGTVPPFEEGVLYETVYADQNPNWLNQEYGIFSTSSSIVPTIMSNSQFDVDVFRYPIMANAKDPGISTSPSMILTVYNKSKYQEEAAEFLDWYLNNEEAILTTLDTRGVPANSKARELLEAKDLLSKQVTNHVNQALSGSGSPENGLSLNVEILALIKEYIHEVGYLNMTPEKATEELTKELQYMLEEVQKADKKN